MCAGGETRVATATPSWNETVARFVILSQVLSLVAAGVQAATFNRRVSVRS